MVKIWETKVTAIRYSK